MPRAAIAKLSVPPLRRVLVPRYPLGVQSPADCGAGDEPEHDGRDEGERDERAQPRENSTPNAQRFGTSLTSWPSLLSVSR